MSLYSLCNVSVFFSFINFDLWFRCQVYLAFVSHKHLCIKFEYYLGLALQNQETVSELLVPSFGVCVEGQSSRNPPVCYIFATFLDPVWMNSEGAVA